MLAPVLTLFLCVYVSFSYVSTVAVRKSLRRRQTVTSSPIQTIVFSSLAEHAARRRNETASTGCSKNMHTVYDTLLDDFRLGLPLLSTSKENKLV